MNRLCWIVPVLALSTSVLAPTSASAQRRGIIAPRYPQRFGPAPPQPAVQVPVRALLNPPPANTVIRRLLNERLPDGSYTDKVWPLDRPMPEFDPTATQRFVIEVFPDRSDLRTEIGGANRLERFVPVPPGSPGVGWLVNLRDIREVWAILPGGARENIYLSTTGRRETLPHATLLDWLLW